MQVKTIKELPKNLIPKSYYRYKTVDKALTPQVDIDILCKLTAYRNPKVALEIGTAQGHGTKAIAMNMPEGVLYTIDLEGDGTFCKKDEIGNVAKGIPNVRFLRGDSKTFQYFKVGLDCNCEMAFIDGCHDYINVHDDTWVALKHLWGIDNALLIWHDYNSPYKTDHVTEVVDSLFKGEFPFQIYHIEGTWIAFTILGKNWREL